MDLRMQETEFSRQRYLGAARPVFLLRVVSRLVLPEFLVVIEIVAAKARIQREELTREGKNVSHPEEYDLVVLGSGRARFFAWSLASQGKRVAVVERRNLAGSCPTIACAPSKNVIHGAKVANYFRRGAEFGIAAGDWKVEMAAVRDRKRKMVDGIVALNVNAYRESGAELVKGQGRFVGPRTIEVTADDGTRTLRGEVVVI